MKRLVELGATKAQVRRLVQKGSLKRIANGLVAPAGAPETWLYKVSAGIQRAGALSDLERITSAGCGITAAMMLELILPKPEREVHVLSTRVVAPWEGYVFHQTNRLPAEEITRVEGLPVTDPIRTFLDICALAPPMAPWILEQIYRKHDVTREMVIARRAGESRQGRAGLVLSDQLLGLADEEIAKTRSGRESEVLRWIKEAGLPLPQRNVYIPSRYGHQWEIDMFYPARKIVIEVSPSITHGPEVSDKDRLKDAELQELGYIVIHVTDSTDRYDFIARLSRLLGL